jgi:hypothetical protein
MTMRDLHNNLDAVQAIQAQTITQAGGAIQSGNVDLKGFGSAEVLVHFGDIDEMGGSPLGGAKIDVKIEHADDDGAGAPGAYANVTLADVLGPAAVTSGIVASPTTDTDVVQVGYVGDKRFLRVTLTPTGLTNGGPVGAVVVKGHPRHAPAA